MNDSDRVLDALAADQDGFWMALWMIDACEGDMNAARMLARLLYWFKRGKDGEPRARIMRDGKRWMAKRHDDWWDEIRLGEHQAKRAAARLMSLGLIESDHFLYQGMRTVHHRLRSDEIARAVGADLHRPVSAKVLSPVGADSLQPSTVDLTRDLIKGRTAPAADDAAARAATPSATNGGDPRAAAVASAKPDRWWWVKVAVAESITGRPDGGLKKNGAHEARVCHIVGDLGRLADDDPMAAEAVWLKFVEGLTPSQRTDRLTMAAARDWLGRWASGAGAEWIGQCAAHYRQERADLAHTRELWLNTVETYGEDEARAVFEDGGLVVPDLEAARA